MYMASRPPERSDSLTSAPTKGRTIGAARDDRQIHSEELKHLAESFIAPCSLAPAPTLYRTSESAEVSIALVLLPGFDLFDVAVLSESFGLCNVVARRQIFSLDIAALGPGSVASALGVEMTSLQSIADVGTNTNAFLLGGNVRSTADIAMLRNWILQRRGHSGRLAAVGEACGTLLATGLLEDQTMAVHWQALPPTRGAYPSARLTERLFVVDRHLMTCCGKAATLDFALYCIADICGASVALEVADLLNCGRPREHGRGQRSMSTLHSEETPEKVQRAISLMRENIVTPLSMETLATRVGTTLRQLQRQFLCHVGDKPGRVYQSIRLHCARHLLRETALPLMSIAAMTGFKTPCHLSSRYLGLFGVRPSKDRHSPLFHSLNEGQAIKRQKYLSVG